MYRRNTEYWWIKTKKAWLFQSWYPLLDSLSWGMTANKKSGRQGDKPNPLPLLHFNCCGTINSTHHPSTCSSGLGFMHFYVLVSGCVDTKVSNYNHIPHKTWSLFTDLWKLYKLWCWLLIKGATGMSSFLKLENKFCQNFSSIIMYFTWRGVRKFMASHKTFVIQNTHTLLGRLTHACIFERDKSYFIVPEIWYPLSNENYLMVVIF